MASNRQYRLAEAGWGARCWEGLPRKGRGPLVGRRGAEGAFAACQGRQGAQAGVYMVYECVVGVCVRAWRACQWSAVESVRMC